MQTRAYELREVVARALPVTAVNEASPAELSRAVRYVDVQGTGAFVATNDGFVHRYEISSRRAGKPLWQLQQSACISRSGKPVEKVLALPSIKLVVVLCESTLSFLSYLTLSAPAGKAWPSIKGVAQFVLDSAEAAQQSIAELGFVTLCVLKRKSILLAMVNAHSWGVVKEVSMARGAIFAGRYNEAVCAATTTEYVMVDMDAGYKTPVGLPITHTTDMPSAQMRPSIVPFAMRGSNDKAQDYDAGHFMVTSHTDSISLGSVIRSDGEPSGKLVEWPSHPRSLALEYPYLCALLRNQQISVHDLRTWRQVQTITLPDNLDARFLTTIPPSDELLESSDSLLDESLVNVLSPSSSSPDLDVCSHGKSSFAPVTILVGSRTSLYCLVKHADPVVALRCLESGDLFGAKRILDEAWQRRPGPPDTELGEYSTGDRATRELRAVYLLLGLRHLKETHFDYCTPLLIRGDADPRLLLCKYARFRAFLGPESARLSIPTLCTHTWASLPETIEGLICANVSKNYSPEMPLENSILEELQDALGRRAMGLLRAVLDAYLRVHSRNNLTPILQAIQVEIILDQNPREPLEKLDPYLDGSSLDMIEDSLRKRQRYVALARHLLRVGNLDRVLQLQRRLIDGELHDAADSVRVRDIAPLLAQLRANAQIAEYGVWLLDHDLDLSLHELYRVDYADDVDAQAILQAVRRRNDHAADALLEHIVLCGHGQGEHFAAKLLDRLLLRTLAAVHDSDAALTRLSENYATEENAESFAAHVAMLASSGSQDARDRIKLMTMLEYSDIRDYHTVLARLADQPKLLYEQAIVLGKHAEALGILALELRDANSAEAFCLQGGRVLSPTLARTVTANAGVPEYAKLIPQDKSVACDDAKKRSQLFKDLLRVYMQNSAGELRTPIAHLLSTQTDEFDMLQVLEFVPRDWPLADLQTYLQRSLRRELHARCDAAIVKSLAFAQSLSARERHWRYARSLGGIVQDGDDDEPAEDAHAPAATVEKAPRAAESEKVEVTELSMPEKGLPPTPEREEKREA